MLLIDHSEYNLYSINQKINHKLVIPILGSLLDSNLLEIIFNKYSIDTIYHAAAYKHVPLLQQNSFVGSKNNIIGTYMLQQKQKIQS